MNLYFANIYLIITNIIFQTSSIFSIPEVTFEALKSGGFRAYIPSANDVNFFVLNGNLNKEISLTEPGHINNETRIVEDNNLILYFPEKLKIGDVLHFWIFIIANRAGYTGKIQSWEVAELFDSYRSLENVSCTKSITIMNSQNKCKDALIFEEDFDQNSLNISKWIIEQRIPTYAGPDFEFNSYEKSNETCFIQNGVLYLKPLVLYEEDEVRGELNLRNGCTANNDSECYYHHVSAFLLPPVKSAKITSRDSITYGRIDIRAQFPVGDWIFPILQLKLKDETNAIPVKIVIAFSRGNNLLHSIDVRSMDTYVDIGSRQLTAGPIFPIAEPNRSKYTIKLMKSDPFYNEFHTYGLEWTPGKMIFYIDSEEYGTILLDNISNFNADSLDNKHWITTNSPFDEQFQLSLGVAVGGLSDFPDGYNSGGVEKPWQNDERNYIKKFFDSRNIWSKTWISDRVALKVDSVKIYAV